MGQFKPMVKMETTEPSVILKLAKGGAVKMKKGGSATKKMAMGGGSMDMMMGTPALVGRPAVNAPVRAPGKPSMASRRRAMMPKKPMMAPPADMPPMKKGGKAEGGESKGMHKAEMKAIEGVDSKLSKHASMAASKGHKGLKTGGVALGNAGGFKTGGVAMGNAGGFKTGGVTMGNAGGFKHGGKSSKKAYATGGTVNSGRPVAMPQGAKKPSAPVSIDRLSGTFKRGGTVKMNHGGGQGHMTDKTMEDSYIGAVPFDDKYFVDDPKAVSDKASRDLEEALNPLSMVKELYGKARDAFRGQGSVSDKEKSMPSPKKGAVTKTEKSITVTPAGKRRGGRAC
jgi:hypothetical protein